mgnify:CR=1 FL=1
MGMTLKELLTKGEGTLSAQEAKELASQCRMDVETLYTLLEERGIKVLDNEAEEDASLDVDSIIAEVENAEAMLKIVWLTVIGSAGFITSPVSTI